MASGLWAVLLWWVAAFAAPPSAVLKDVDRGPVTVVPGRVVVHAEPFADGLVREHAPTAVRVLAANGLANTRLVLSIDAQGVLSDGSFRYERLLDLPKGSRKQVDLVYEPGFGGPTRTLDVAAGDQHLQVEFPVTLLGDEDVGIAVIGPRSLGVNAVSDAWGGPVPGLHVRERQNDPREVRVGLVPVDALPESMTPWEGLDWVVWPHPDTSRVTPGALDALRAWVANGGHLLVVVTDDWREVAASPLASMLPVKLTGVADTPGLGAFAGSLGMAPGRAAVAPVALGTLVSDPERGAVALARIQVGTTSDPVWAAGTFGLGTVHVLLADPEVEPLQSLDRQVLWRHLLWLPPKGAGDAWVWRDPTSGWDASAWAVGAHGWYFPNYSAYGNRYRRLLAHLGLAAPSASDFYVAGKSRYGASDAWVGGDPILQWENDVRSYLSKIPGVAPLPLPWLLAFAGLYLLCIGPVDYFVLRALRRPAWTWVTFPVTIVLFSTAALVGTSLLKGNQAVLTRFEVVDVLPGTDLGGKRLWRGETWMGVWATRKTTITLDPGLPGALVEPQEETGAMWSPVQRSTEGGGQMSWDAETWTLGYARAAWTAPKAGGVRLEALPQGGWRIHNDLGVDLARADLAARGRVLVLGALPAGGSVDVAAPPEAGSSLADLERIAAARGVELQSDTDALSLRWAERTAMEHPEPGRGHLDLQGQVALVGVTRQPVEPVRIAGLAPSTHAVTVFRVPLALQGSGGPS